MRVFIAQEVSPEPFLDELEKMRGSGIRAKWVDPGVLHITHQFLGEVDSPKLAAVEKALDSLAGSGCFEVELRGLGAFPNPRRPRVLWIGARSEKLIELMRRVRLLMGGLGFTENRKPEGHVTLARLREPSDLSGLCRKYLGHLFSTFTADKLLLKESILMPDGPVYRTRHEVNL